MNDKQWQLVVNLLTIIPAIVKNIPGTIDLYNKMILALQDGVTDEEWSALLQERDAIIEKILDQTKDEQ